MSKTKWPGDEGKVLSLLEERLRKGLKLYGALDVHDKRNKPQEALEEALDMAIYVATQLIALAEREQTAEERVTMEALRNQIADRDAHIARMQELINNDGPTSWVEPLATCGVCGKPPGFGCREHFVREINRLNEELEEATLYLEER